MQGTVAADAHPTRSVWVPGHRARCRPCYTQTGFVFTVAHLFVSVMFRSMQHKWRSPYVQTSSDNLKTETHQFSIMRGNRPVVVTTAMLVVGYLNHVFSYRGEHAFGCL